MLGAELTGVVVAGAVVAGVVVVGAAFVGFAALAGAIPRAIAVVMSTVPVVVSPRALWKADTAAAVPAPNTPSAPPRTLSPVAMRAFCIVVTAVPRSPRLGNAGDGANPSRKAVEGSISPLATNPLAVWKVRRAESVL